MITLLTDFGADSIYATQAKVWLKSRLPEVEVIDISHQIRSCDLNEAAYVLELMIGSFPDQTVHIVAVDFDNRHEYTEIIHFEWKSQHILTYNSGFASLFLKGNISPPIHEVTQYKGGHLTSVSRGIGQHAIDLHQAPQNDKNYRIADKANIKTPLHPVSNKDNLHGHVMYFDANGTAYTNISQGDFEQFTGNDGFGIVLSRHERITSLSDELQYREGGSTVCYFNAAGYLTISIHRGKAKNMYGLKKGQTIIIEKT